MIRNVVKLLNPVTGVLVPHAATSNWNGRCFSSLPSNCSKSCGYREKAERTNQCCRYIRQENNVKRDHPLSLNNLIQDDSWGSSASIEHSSGSSGSDHRSGGVD